MKTQLTHFPEDDLHELSEFLEVTYRIRAERQHLELLILKVLPLMSINSKIFLNGLITAFEGPLVNPSPHLVAVLLIIQQYIVRPTVRTIQYTNLNIVIIRYRDLDIVTV